MRPAAHSLAAIILTILCTVAVRPQSLSIYNVDVRNFPVMKATMLAFNPDGSKAQPVISNLMLKENGVQRTITDVQCTPVQGNIPLSPVLTIDLSASMAGGNGSETNLDIAKAFATAFVNRLPLGTGSKCAITTFSDTNTLNSPFTASGSALLSVIGALQPAGGTNYDAAFLDAPAGALRVTGVGNNKRMIILVADGTPNTLPVVSTILKEAARLNTQIHCIMIGITAPQWLNDISVKTGGVVFNNITNSTQARMAAYELVTLAQGGTHCELTWQTEAPCMILPTDVSVLWGTTADTVTYTPPFRVLAELRCTPAFVAFGRRTLTGSYDTAITLEARNSAIRVLDIKPKIATAAFSILENFPLDIPSGGKRTIMIRYFATDSVKRYAAFDIVTDKCPATFSVNAGYIQGKQKTLEITRPAGGETYIAGNAMEIEWRGIAASDTVTLLYSLNNGATWNIIVNKATMFRHIWKNVPVVNNAKLLIRAVQRSDGSGNGLSPEAEWTRTYGGSGFDNINAVRATQDGGYILAGFSHSSDLDTLITPNGVRDVWLVKIDRNGTVEWQRTLGGSRSDGARDVRQTRDGGYIIAGYTESGDGNVTDRFGLQDMWIVKTDAKGVIEWQRSYGGLYDDDASAVQEVPGGGYVFAGFTRSNNAYVSGNKGLTDAWIVRTDDKGGLLWQRTLGGSNHDYARGISVTADGMYLVSGYSESDNGDVAQNKGDSDAWSVVLSSGGDAIVWQKSVGGSIYDGYNAVTLSSKDIVAAAGSTLSSNGDITTNKGSGDGLFVRMNLDGSEARITNYGGSNSDVFNAVAQTRNGDYVMAGSTSSSDGDIPSNRGLSDFWILRADSNGVVEWSRAMGGSKLDDARAVIETPDGGLLIAGSTASSDGDVGFNRGDGDAWVVKLGGSSSGVLQDDTLSIPVTIVVPTSTSVPVIDLKKCVVGSAKDSLVQQSLRNTSSYPVRIDSMRITGADQNQFRILSAMPPFTIASGATRSMEYRFRPLATGVRTATLEIFTQTDTLRQTLTGEGIASVFQLQTTFVDFGRIANGTRRDTTIPAFQNTSTQPMRVSSMYVGGLQSANFSVIAGNAPVIIQPQAFHTIGIRCTGIDSGIVFARLFFVFDGTDSPQSIPLAVDVFNRVVLPVRDTVASTISLSQVEAPAGTRVNIHLVNSEQRNMQIANAPKKFEAKVRVNPTVVLTDVTPYPCISIDATTCELTIGGERSTSDTLASFGAIATLGTTDNSVLEIASFRWFTTDSMIVTDTRLRNGSVKITDVCDAGGVRLFIPTGAKQSLSIRPNPASTAALIEYGLAESTVATLEIINSMGQVVASPVFQRQLRAGIYQNTLDVNTIPSGTYIVRLSTPNSILTTRMDVVR